MNEQEIFNKLVSMIKQLFKDSKFINFDTVTLDSKPVDDLSFDSMDLIMVSFAIEKEFQIDISGLTVSSFSTIRNVVDYIKEKLSVH